MLDQTMRHDGPSLSTEYPFTLPRGYVDARGQVHRDGVMRLATAGDEIWPQTDPRVRENRAYLSVLLLTRTVTHLGSLPEVDSRVIENLFASDLAFLQDLYRRINQDGGTRVHVACPKCAHDFAVDISGDASGGS
ncbi:MAG: phage tail assembly protein [Ilumatobacteraceae bacterium]|jgi:hypothetical protein